MDNKQEERVRAKDRLSKEERWAINKINQAKAPYLVNRENEVVKKRINKKMTWQEKQQIPSRIRQAHP